MSGYDGINNLNDLEAGTPLSGASTAELAEAIRQIKSVFKNVLLTSLRPNGQLQGISVESIAEGAVGTAQIADEAVTAAKLAQYAVLSDNLADGAIESVKIADGAVTAAKLAANSILAAAFSDNCIPLRAFAEKLTGDQISSSTDNDNLRAISTLHLKDKAVTDRTINDVAIGKVSGGSPGQVVVIGAGSILTPVTPAGGFHYDPVSQNFSFDSQISAAQFGDFKSRGVDGGATAGGTWMTRDLGEISDERGIMTFVGNNFKLLEGSYLFYARCPAANAVGKHQARLMRDNGDGTKTPVLWGSSMQCAAGNTNDSVIAGVFLATANPNHLYRIEHYFENSVASNGLGVAAASNNTEVFPNHSEVYTAGYLCRI